MANRINNTGRNKSNRKHVRHYAYELDCSAYRSLSVYSRALLVEFKRLYNGSNNGQIGLSLRQAATACNCSEKPLRTAFKELQHKGFIKVKSRGAFSIKINRATEWILTEFPVGKQPATKEFMRWKPTPEEKITVYPEPQRGVPRATAKPKSGQKRASRCTESTPQPPKSPFHGVPRVRTYNIPCRGSEATASGPPKGPAQSGAGSTVIPFTKSQNPHADVVRALGGFCKASRISKQTFEAIVSQHSETPMQDNAIRSAAFHNHLRLAGAS